MRLLIVCVLACLLAVISAHPDLFDLDNEDVGKQHGSGSPLRMKRQFGYGGYGGGWGRPWGGGWGRPWGGGWGRPWGGGFGGPFGGGFGGPFGGWG